MDIYLAAASIPNYMMIIALMINCLRWSMTIQSLEKITLTSEQRGILYLSLSSSCLVIVAILIYRMVQLMNSTLNSDFLLEVLIFIFNRIMYLSIMGFYSYILYYFYKYLHHKVLKEDGNFS